MQERNFLSIINLFHIAQVILLHYVFYDCFYFLTQVRGMIIVYAPYYCKEYYDSFCSGDADANMLSYDLLLSLV
jgi:hypothetical protein